MAAVASKFVCIADRSKLVDALGGFPLPVEVYRWRFVHRARALQAGRAIRMAAGIPHRQRQVILDVRGLSIVAPFELRPS